MQLHVKQEKPPLFNSSEKSSRRSDHLLYIFLLDRAESKGTICLKPEFCQNRTKFNQYVDNKKKKRQMGEIYEEPFWKMAWNRWFPKRSQCIKCFWPVRMKGERDVLISIWVLADWGSYGLSGVSIWTSKAISLYYEKSRRSWILWLVIVLKRKKITFHFSPLAKSPVAVWRTFQITATTARSFWVSYFWLIFYKCSHHPTQTCK